jgi:hypothetical protein
MRNKRDKRDKPPSNAGLPNKMSAKSAISAKSPPLTAGMPMLCGSGAMLGNFSGRISMGRTLPCLCLEQVAYMDKFRRAGWVGLSVLCGQAADKRDDICLGDRGWRVSRLSASVLSGLGWPQAGVRCFPSCQNCSIKRTHWAPPAKSTFAITLAQ